MSGPPTKDDPKTTTTVIISSGGSKESLGKAALGKLKESKKNGDISQTIPPVEGEAKEEQIPRKPRSEHKMEGGGERIKEREREKDRGKVRDRERGRDSDREREWEDGERDRGKIKDRTHRSKEKGRDSGKFRSSSIFIFSTVKHYL